jgi:YcxB-like protein
VIELHGTFTLSDFVRFHYFHTLRLCWWLLAIVAVFLLIVAPLFLALFVNTYPPVVSWSSVEEGAVPFVAGCLVLTYALTVMPYQRAKKQYAAQNYLREPVRTSFAAEGISSEGSGISSKVVWSIVKQVRETKSLFLLYYSANMALIVPKHFFEAPDQMDQWRQLVAASIDPKLIEKRGLVGRWC